MCHRILRATLLLCLAVSLSGQTGEWKKYKNVEGNLAVLFPSDPQDSINKNDSGIQSHNLMVQTQAGVYLVVYTSMVGEQPVNDATFQVFKTAAFAELPKCVADAETAANPAIQGFIGHSYRLNCEMPNTKIAVEGNLYWGKHYAYAVLVMYAIPGARPDGAAKFMESFSVIDEKKIPGQ
ncbi:MAG TPA: hypothetical protein VKW06_17595 [Candidatus Angelobacter sp.]|nr:hypothetical protein [Candidatus Angelobacter sp.]